MRPTEPIAIASGHDDIQAELTALIFERLLPRVLVGCAGIVLAICLIATLHKDALLWGALFLGVLACLARGGVVFAHSRLPIDVTLSAEEAARWEVFYGVSTIAYTAIVSLTTLRVFSIHDVAGELLCAVACVGVSASLGARPGLRPLLLKIGGLIPVATLAVAALVFGPLQVKAAGVLAVLYGLGFIESADCNFDRVVEQFRAKRTMLMNSQLDPLTALPNRKYMKTRLAELCKSNTPFAVLFLDLDDFKIVNDTMGHGAGDDLLMQVTARLKSMMRETDLLARVGGDEFCVLQIPAKNKREVVALAERINQQIAAPYRIHGEKAVIGVSVGVRLALGGVNEPDEVLHRADTALYNVKAGGKGGYSVALD